MFGVKQVHGCYRKAVISRRLACPRSGSAKSARATSDSNSCLSEGLAATCSRRHSSTGTRTAASVPRLVTIWGPLAKHASKNSLNRAFASCTGHVSIASPEASHVTSLFAPPGSCQAQSARAVGNLCPRRLRVGVVVLGSGLVPVLVEKFRTHLARWFSPPQQGTIPESSRDVHQLGMLAVDDYLDQRSSPHGHL